MSAIPIGPLFILCLGSLSSPASLELPPQECIWTVIKFQWQMSSGFTEQWKRPKIGYSGPEPSDYLGVWMSLVSAEVMCQLCWRICNMTGPPLNNDNDAWNLHPGLRKCGYIPYLFLSYSKVKQEGQKKSNFTQCFHFKHSVPSRKKPQDLFTFPLVLSCGRDATWWLAWNLSQWISAMAKTFFYLNLTHSSVASLSSQS